MQFAIMNQHKLLHWEDYDLSLEDTNDGIWAQNRLAHEIISSIEQFIACTISPNARYHLCINVEFPTFKQPVATIEYYGSNKWHEFVCGWTKNYGLTPYGELESTDGGHLDEIAAGIDEVAKKVVPDDVLCYVAQLLSGDGMQTTRLYKYGKEPEGRRTTFSLGEWLIDSYPRMVVHTDRDYTAFFSGGSNVDD